MQVIINPSLDNSDNPFSVWISRNISRAYEFISHGYSPEAETSTAPQNSSHLPGCLCKYYVGFFVNILKAKPVLVDIQVVQTFLS